MEQRNGDQDPLLERVRIMNGVIFALLLLISLTLMSPFFTLGVAMGGLIVLINFLLLYRILKKAFIPERLASPKVVILKYYLRLLGTAYLLYVSDCKKVGRPPGTGGRVYRWWSSL